MTNFDLIHVVRYHLTWILWRHWLILIWDAIKLIIVTPGIQKHVTVLNTRNGTKVYIGMIKGELYLFSNNKQCGHLPTANVYIHIEYYF